MKFLLLTGLLLATPLVVFGADASYVSLTNAPFLESAGNAASLPAFLNDIYKICIGLAAVLAVLQIMRAGIMYMGSDTGFAEKKEAKNLIALAIGGLILILSPVIVFSIINPDILDLKINGLSDLKTTGGLPASWDPGGQELICKAKYVGQGQAAQLAAGETCSSKLGVDWEEANVQCCLIVKDGETCCGRNPQLPDQPVYGGGKATFKIAVESTDIAKLGTPRCVRFITGSSESDTECSFAAIAEEDKLKKNLDDYLVMKTCASPVVKPLFGTRFAELPTCSQ